MAHFRTLIRGTKGRARDVTRLAHSWCTVEAQSYQGKVVTTLERCGETDKAMVWLAPHMGKGDNVLIYEGPVGCYAPQGGLSKDDLGAIYARLANTAGEHREAASVAPKQAMRDFHTKSADECARLAGLVEEALRHVEKKR